MVKIDLPPFYNMQLVVVVFAKEINGLIGGFLWQFFPTVVDAYYNRHKRELDSVVPSKVER